MIILSVVGLFKDHKAAILTLKCLQEAAFDSIIPEAASDKLILMRKYEEEFQYAFSKLVSNLKESIKS